MIFRTVVGVSGGEKVGAGFVGGEMEDAGGADEPGAVGTGRGLEDPADHGVDGGGGEFGMGGLLA